MTRIQNRLIRCKLISFFAGEINHCWKLVASVSIITPLHSNRTIVMYKKNISEALLLKNNWIEFNIKFSPSNRNETVLQNIIIGYVLYYRLYSKLSLNHRQYNNLSRIFQLFLIEHFYLFLQPAARVPFLSYAIATIFLLLVHYVPDFCVCVCRTIFINQLNAWNVAENWLADNHSM